MAVITLEFAETDLVLKQQIIAQMTVCAAEIVELTGQPMAIAVCADGRQSMSFPLAAPVTLQAMK